MLETGPVRQVLDAPAAPYTRALMAAIPSLGAPTHRLPVRACSIGARSLPSASGRR
ncbi:MAG: hypothetical protein RR726_10475 [Pseudomonas sp.]